MKTTSQNSNTGRSGTDVDVVDRSVMLRDVVDGRTQICRQLQASPIPENELIRNLGLYLLPMELKRFLFFADLYQQFLDVPGVIMEFGCRWGQNLATLQSLRSILEPYHHRRKIIGFDTFDGFPDVQVQDGVADIVREGAYTTSEDYPGHLAEVMRLRESQAPLSEVQKFEIVPGDASSTLPKYLEQHPETIVAFAYFDMDLYRPTRDCITILKDRLTQGAIVGFDELNHQNFPGETAAVIDTLGLDRIRLKRSPFSADECYFVVQ